MNERIILKCILNKQCVKKWTDSSGSGESPVVVLCEHGNELSGSTFSFTIGSRLSLGPTQSPVRWVLGLFPGGKTTGSWSWPFTPSRAKVKNAWRYTSTPQYAFFARCSVVARGQL
jgi:hypothetical protein